MSDLGKANHYDLVDTSKVLYPTFKSPMISTSLGEFTKVKQHPDSLQKRNRLPESNLLIFQIITIKQLICVKLYGVKLISSLLAQSTQS